MQTPHQFVQVDPDGESLTLYETEAANMMESSSVSDNESDDMQAIVLQESLNKMKTEYSKLKDAYLALKDKNEKQEPSRQIHLSLVNETLHVSASKTVSKEAVATQLIDELSAAVSSMKQSWGNVSIPTQAVVNRNAPRRPLNEPSYGNPSRSEPTCAATEFARLLIRRFKTLQGAWDVLDPSKSGKVSFVGFCSIMRKNGLSGNMRQIWIGLGGDVTGVLSKRDFLIVGYRIKAEQFIASLSVKCGGDLKMTWNLFYKTSTGLLSLDDFERMTSNLLKMKPDEIKCAFKGLLNMDQSQLIDWQDVARIANSPHKGLFRLNSIKVNSFDQFKSLLIFEFGSMAMGWMRLFPEKEEISSFSDFALALRSRYSGSLKELWVELNGTSSVGVKLSAFDFEFHEAILILRNVFRGDGWLNSGIDNDGVFGIGLSSWEIKVCEILERRSFKFPGKTNDFLRSLFLFFDQTESGFICAEDFDDQWLSDLVKQDNAVLGGVTNGVYREIVEAYKFSSSAKVEVKKFQIEPNYHLSSFAAFLIARFGNLVAAFVQAFDVTGKGGFTLPSFIGSARGLGWLKDLKAFWSYGFAMKRDAVVDLKVFCSIIKGGDRNGMHSISNADVELVAHLYSNVRREHGAVTRAWRMAFDPRNSGMVSRDIFKHLCGTGEACPGITEAEGAKVFDLLDAHKQGTITMAQFCGAGK